MKKNKTTPLIPPTKAAAEPKPQGGSVEGLLLRFHECMDQITRAQSEAKQIATHLFNEVIAREARLSELEAKTPKG